MTEKQTQEAGYEVLRRRMAEGAAGFHLPRYRELPDVGLYLEQVVRLVNQLTAGRPGPLTASMVSNYVKQKLLPGPIRKIYGRESLAYLVFLAGGHTPDGGNPEEQLRPGPGVRLFL